MSTSPRQIMFACVLAAAGCFVDRGPGIGATTMEVDTSGQPSTQTPTTGSPTVGEQTTGESTTETTGNPGVNGVCEERCVLAEDCSSPDKDVPTACEDGRCVSVSLGQSKSCSNDSSCQATQSGWVKPCMGPVDCICEEGMECVEEKCIDIGGGVGRCAIEVTADTLCLDGLAQAKMPLLNNPETIAVCASALFACDKGVCRDFCKSAKGCVEAPGHPQCVVETGTCVCISDEQCMTSGQAGYVACRDGRCGCTDDADCVGVPNADTCLPDGRCGCTSVAVCTQKVFTGTTMVCAP